MEIPEDEAKRAAIIDKRLHGIERWLDRLELTTWHLTMIYIVTWLIQLAAVIGLYFVK